MLTSQLKLKCWQISTPLEWHQTEMFFSAVISVNDCWELIQTTDSKMLPMESGWLN